MIIGIIISFVSVLMYFKAENLSNFQKSHQNKFIINKHEKNFVLLFSKFFGASKLPRAQQEAVSISTSAPEVIAVFYNRGKGLILVKENEKTKWVKVGEVVNGWKVKKILPSEVFFEAKGTIVKKRIFTFNEEQTVSGSGSEKVLKGKVIIISREEMQRLTSDIGSLFSQIGLRPFFIGGKIVGMFVSYIKPGSIFAKAGLREGDIILTINNIPIRTTEDSYRIFETLKTASYIEVKVRRGNQILTFRAEVR